VSFFSIVARVSVDGVCQNVPLAFKITRNGTADTESKAVIESLETEMPAINNEYGFSCSSMLSRVVSSTSDGASNATKTSKLVGEAKTKAIEAIKAAFDPTSPEVKAMCTEFHVLHCANHALNLLAGACHKIEERAHLGFMKALADIVRIQRQFRQRHPAAPPEYIGAPVQYQNLHPSRAKGDNNFKQLFTSTETTAENNTVTSWYSLTVSNTLWCVSKLFASFGDHSEYHLNESALYTTWLKGLGEDGLLYKAGALPSVKGSRQMITVELATYVALNRRGFLM
jgi:hypothetical protein